MEGLERILSRLEEDAQGEIDKILENAQEEVHRIEESFASLASREAEEQTAACERAALALEAQIADGAQLETGKTLLRGKQTWVQRAYERAEEKLCALPTEAYRTMLETLLMRAAPDGRGEVLVSKRDQTLGKEIVRAVNEKIGGQLVLSKEMRSLKGGLLLRKGRVEVDCSVEMLVALQKEETMGTVAKLLFGEEAP